MYHSTASFLQAVEDLYAEAGEEVKLCFDTPDTLTFRCGRDVTVEIDTISKAYNGGKVPNALFKARWKLDIEYSIQRGLARFQGQNIIQNCLEEAS